MMKIIRIGKNDYRVASYILSGRRIRRTYIYTITFHSPYSICFYTWYLDISERISDTVVN